jgi:hypothetical protein
MGRDLMKFSLREEEATVKVKLTGTGTDLFFPLENV